MATNNITNDGTRTAHSIPVEQGGGSSPQYKTLTDGQLLIGSTGADPVAATPSVAGNPNALTITPGAGTLAIQPNSTQYIGWRTGALQMLLALPGAFTGQTFTNTITVANDGSNLNNAVCYFPFYVPNAFTSANLYFRVATLLAGSSINFSVYASESLNRYPALNAAPLVSVNESTATSGNHVPAFVYAFQANTLYWLGVQTSSATTLALSAMPLSFGNWGAGVSNLSTSFASSVIGRAGAFSAGVYPNTPATAGGFSNLTIINFPMFAVL